MEQNNFEIDYMCLEDLENLKDIFENDFDDFWNYNVFKSELENPNSTYFVVKFDGEIVGFDDETAADTKGYKTPKEYWENEDLEGLKAKLAKMFEDTKTNICTSDCNK